MELIGNDLFATKLNFAFSLDHMEVLMALYQPLLSKQALNLYYTLLARSNRGQMFEMHHTLCEKMQLRIDEIEQARIELEQFLLLRTMMVRKEKTNIYYYVIQIPKTFTQFLKHDLFSRLLITKVGSPYIRKLIEAQSNEDEWSELEEITCHMKLDFSTWTYEKEDQFNALVNDFVEDEKEDPYVRYDIMSYLRANDAVGFLIPHQDLKQADISYINYCGQTYDIAHDEMVRMLKTHYQRANKELNRDGLQQSCINSVRRRKGVLPSESVASSNSVSQVQTGVITNTSSNPAAIPVNPLAKYQLSAVDFVHALIPNMILSQSEAESFPRLQSEYKFSNEVFNALLEFVWMKSKNFNFKFLDKICAVWARANINTLERALDQLKEPVSTNANPVFNQPRTRKNPRIVETMPTYSETSNQDIDIDYDELSSLLQSLEQKRQSWSKS